MKPDAKDCSSCDQITKHSHIEESSSGGLKYDSEKPPVALVPGEAIIEIARVLGFGARKYAAHNWRKGILYSRLISAAQRHILAFNSREDKDEESGLSHIAHALCCLVFLSTFETEGRSDLDDRYISESVGKPIQKEDVHQTHKLCGPDIECDYCDARAEYRMQAMADAVKKQYDIEMGTPEHNPIYTERKTQDCYCGDPNCQGSGAI